MRRSSIRLVLGLTVAAATLGMVAEGAQAKRRRRLNPRLARAPLYLSSFLQDGRTDVRRNEQLVFKFTALLRTGSLENRTVQIAAVTPSGVRPARGALRAKGTKVFFDPTRTQRNFDESRKKNSTVTDKDNPTGFEAFQDYTILLPAAPELNTLQNKRRDPLRQEFTSNFRTNGTYDDPVAGQPQFIGDFGTGKLGFDPPRSGSTGLVDEDAIVVFEFSEPIDINTLDPSSSVTVERIAIGEPVPGFIRLDPLDGSGRRFQFVPSLGFGSDEVNSSGWDIVVRLTTSVKDLAGNPLKRPVEFPVFRTRFVPGKPSSSILSEGFDDQTRQDPLSILEGAEWDTLEEGFLLGGVPTTFPNVDVQYTTASTGTAIVRTRVAEPLVAEAVPASGGGGCATVPQGSRTQMLYIPADIGAEAAVVGVGWGPSSNALFAATYPDIELRLGHTSVATLGSDWDANVNLGSPLLVYQGDYHVPQALDIFPGGVDMGYWDWPTFTSVFEYNGFNNFVFDAKAPGGNNCQILRVGFVPAGVTFANRRAVSRNAESPTADFGLGADKVIYDIRLKKRRRTTRATSNFIELASDNPVLAAPILSPPGQSGGVDVLLELDGAHGKSDPFNPGGFIADASTATGWTSDATKIDGHRFVRFRVTMVANLTTNQTARVSSIQVPYQF